MDGVTNDTMMGERQFGTARCELDICKALPERMRHRTRELVALRVPEADRRRGLGRELLEQVATEADELGITLILMPISFGDVNAMTSGQLAQWYQRRFGFQAIQAQPIIMVRLPGSSPKFVSPIAAATQTLIDRVSAGFPATERRK